MAIGNVQIATNRYAPSGTDAICLYGSDLAQGLTLTQLIQQVCLRAAAAQEAQSVLKMNMMSADSQKLEEAADWLRKIIAGTANWADAKTFLVDTMEVPESSLPPSLRDGNNKLYYPYQIQAAKALQDKMNLLAQVQQEDMIDLQTSVNRRDVAYSTASGIVRTIGQSMSGNAQNLTRI